MKKTDVSQWIDFVRGVAEPEVERELHRELEAGAEESRREEQRWRRVAALGARDSERQVPEAALRVAQAIGCLRRPDQAEPEAVPFFERLGFDVLFDSLAQPTTGVRGPALAGNPFGGAADAVRHLVLEADRYTVDIRFERQPDPRLTVRPGGFSGAVVAGQILYRNGETQPLPRTPVLVFSGENIVHSTLSSDSGEFHAEGLPEESLKLCLLVGVRECIEVPLGQS